MKERPKRNSEKAIKVASAITFCVSEFHNVCFYLYNVCRKSNADNKIACHLISFGADFCPCAT